MNLTSFSKRIKTNAPRCTIAALTAAAILTAVAATAGTVASIESSNDQRRTANQAANGARQDADKAMLAQANEDKAVQERKAAALARDNQRRRIATGGVNTPMAASPSATGAAAIGGAPSDVPAPSAGGNTLLGS